MTKNILFVGGTGIISSGSSPLVVERGMNLFLLNRGSSFRQPPKGATVIHGDIHNDPQVLAKAVSEHKIDVVVNWIAFTPDDVRRDIDQLMGKIEQYVFISSASAYKKPVPKLPITEETPLGNPFWEYSRNKQACEELLLKAYREQGFPVTIVRPSHTYDQSLFPFHGGYTMIARMLQGKPVLIHGDGTSLWVLTHHKDFAVGFVGLLSNPATVGEIFQITSDELLTWNAIYEMVAAAFDAKLQVVHVTSDRIAAYDPKWGASLLGDKAHSVIFDNSKIKKFVPEFNPSTPFAVGVREIATFYRSHPDRQLVDQDFDRLIDRIIQVAA